jgi:pyridoxine 5'-phosphate synthase PdxJ
MKRPRRFLDARRLRLGVNIDHVATSATLAWPFSESLRAAPAGDEAGADGKTTIWRERSAHIIVQTDIAKS